MAVTKILARKGRLDVGVRYVLNGDKTEEQILTASQGCSTEHAVSRMMKTKRHYSQTDGVQYYHIIQSFRPGEVTPEQAHEIGCEFVRRFLAGRYETVIGTHLDKAHPHNHIVFNACSYADGRMFRNNFNDYYNGIRAVSDALCREYGLSVIEPQNKGKQYREWLDEKEKKPTMRGMVKADVDEVLAAAASFQTFVLGLQRRGYIVKYGPEIKYMAVRHKTGGKFLRLKSLGPEYTEAAIRTPAQGLPPARALCVRAGRIFRFCRPDLPISAPAVQGPAQTRAPPRLLCAARGAAPLRQVSGTASVPAGTQNHGQRRALCVQGADENRDRTHDAPACGAVPEKGGFIQWYEPGGAVRPNRPSDQRAAGYAPGTAPVRTDRDGYGAYPGPACIGPYGRAAGRNEKAKGGEAR